MAVTERSDPTGARPRSVAFRSAQLVLGLFVLGLCIALMIRAELGLGPWDSFHVGISQRTGIGAGMVMNGVGVLIALGTLFIGVRPGPGTIANMLLIGTFTDLILPRLPVAPGLVWAWLYFLSGIALGGLATGMYIGAGFGKGPRDGLMVGLAEKTGWSVRSIRTIMEAAVLAFGWMLGGKVGIGTVVFMLTVGPAAQWGLELFGVRTAPRRPKGTEGAGQAGREAA